MTTPTLTDIQIALSAHLAELGIPPNNRGWILQHCGAAQHVKDVINGLDRLSLSTAVAELRTADETSLAFPSGEPETPADVMPEGLSIKQRMDYARGYLKRH